jgi:hypothetical protein
MSPETQPAMNSAEQTVRPDSPGDTTPAYEQSRSRKRKGGDTEAYRAAKCRHMKAITHAEQHDFELDEQFLTQHNFELDEQFLTQHNFELDEQFLTQHDFELDEQFLTQHNFEMDEQFLTQFQASSNTFQPQSQVSKTSYPDQPSQPPIFDFPFHTTSSWSVPDRA